jgi:hypothetical protein
MVAMVKTPSNLMKIYNFWLTAFGESGPDFETISPLFGAAWVNRAGKASEAEKRKKR